MISWDASGQVSNLQADEAVKAKTFHFTNRTHEDHVSVYHESHPGKRTVTRRKRCFSERSFIFHCPGFNRSRQRSSEWKATAVVRATPVRPGGGQDGERMQSGLTKFPFWGKKTWFHFRGLCMESEEVV